MLDNIFSVLFKLGIIAAVSFGGLCLIYVITRIVTRAILRTIDERKKNGED